VRGTDICKFENVNAVKTAVVWRGCFTQKHPTLALDLPESRVDARTRDLVLIILIILIGS
jgi:hypothetical protein